MCNDFFLSAHPVSLMVFPSSPNLTALEREIRGGWLARQCRQWESVVRVLTMAEAARLGGT